jgi:hypothetical protein
MSNHNRSASGFEAHLEWFETLGYDAAEARKEAQCRHAGFVSAALADLFLGMSMIADELKSKDGVYFMRHGAARRVQMILWSYQAITSMVARDRMAPLSADERPPLIRDINVIYI